jgi:hypothetical protein
MLHVLTLYSVAPEAAGPFVRSIRRGGEWHTLAPRFAPALIASDLLERQPSLAPPFLSGDSILFVCLDFWIPPENYRAPSSSRLVRPCFTPAAGWQTRRSNSAPFAFPRWRTQKASHSQQRRRTELSDAAWHSCRLFNMPSVALLRVPDFGSSIGQRHELCICFLRFLFRVCRKPPPCLIRSFDRRSDRTQQSPV